MIQQKRSSWFKEIKWTRQANFNIHQDPCTSKSGWELSTPSCSDWATKLFKLTSKTTLRSSWTQKIDLWLMSTKRVNALPCLLTKLLIAIMPKWPNVWSTPKIFWHICLTIINNSKIQLPMLLVSKDPRV